MQVTSDRKDVFLCGGPQGSISVCVYVRERERERSHEREHVRESNVTSNLLLIITGIWTQFLLLKTENDSEFSYFLYGAFSCKKVGLLYMESIEVLSVSWNLQVCCQGETWPRTQGMVPECVSFLPLRCWWWMIKSLQGANCWKVLGEPWWQRCRVQRHLKTADTLQSCRSGELEGCGLNTEAVEHAQFSRQSDKCPELDTTTLTGGCSWILHITRQLQGDQVQGQNGWPSWFPSDSPGVCIEHLTLKKSSGPGKWGWLVTFIHIWTNHFYWPGKYPAVSHLRSTSNVGSLVRVERGGASGLPAIPATSIVYGRFPENTAKMPWNLTLDSFLL